MWLKRIRKAMAMLAIASLAQPALADAFFDQTPDSPEGFGFKSSWFAVKTQEPKRVAEILGLADLQRANWASGITANTAGPDEKAGLIPEHLATKGELNDWDLSTIAPI
jgi:hypothetical protein